MSRGNQRDKDREKKEKAMKGMKGKNTQSGTEFARTKEDQAATMRAKQQAAEAKKNANGATPKK
ncbi:4F5 domain protein [Setomelanomma holmii]|uniref:4F5 domain protein n=1 Tax=Setomelanomma holmii TaxID=210430 RepID=A0A9P4LPR7_9PLEO|nr:4F5 domain protein [Setomelanomma holmii]